MILSQAREGGVAGGMGRVSARGYWRHGSRERKGLLVAQVARACEGVTSDAGRASAG